MYPVLEIRGDASYSRRTSASVFVDVMLDVVGPAEQSRLRFQLALESGELVVFGLLADSLGNYSHTRQALWSDINLILILVPHAMSPDHRDAIMAVARGLATRLGWEVWDPEERQRLVWGPSPLPPLPDDPQPEATWRLWYSDAFDRESEPSQELNGQGLACGLLELWVRYLAEELGGFSTFSLEIHGKQLRIEGQRPAMEKLHRWVFQGRGVANGYVQAADAQLTRLLAVRHAQRLCEGQELRSLLTLVDACENEEELKQALGLHS